MSGNFKNLRFALVAATLTMSANGFAQTVVKGTVTDNTGEPVIGASVIEDGTAGNGGVTDLDGNFTITLKGNSKKLKVTYVGMKPQVVNVSGKSVINIKLEDDATSLNDVVVIGYGSVKKKDLTGSVATVNSEALAAVPVASASEALTGKLAGVQVTTSEGSPDADVKIRVRGGGSITQSNDPLFIVDGFPVESISDIPATDIEDISVLKDASSTAIYGSRGANGVILVTTKSGKAGKVNVSYNAYYSVKKIAKKLDVLSPYDYAKWQYELALLKNEDDVSSYTDYFGNYQDMDLYKDVEANDWQDIVYGRTGHTFNHNLNITGGSESVKYAFSYAHMNDKAIQIGSNFKRDNFSLKMNSKPSKTTTLDFQVRYSDTDIRGGGANDATGAYDTDRRLKYSLIYTPVPLKNLNESAGAADDDLGNLFNPVQSQADNDRKKERKQLNFSGAFSWEIFKNFKAKTEFGYDDYKEYDQRFFGLTSYQSRNTYGIYNGKPGITLADTNRHRFRNTNTINYDFKSLIKNDKHSVNLLVGHEYVITKKRVNTDDIRNFPTDFDSETAWKLSAQGTPNKVDANYSADDKLLSFFARANYNFEDKYLLSATFRADASSKFSKENRWGYFPSAAAAWRISSEPFMKSSKKWLDDLKLRLSFGTAGNNNIPVGQLSQMYEAVTGSATGWVNGFPTLWAPSKNMANPNLKWETTITRNLGLDFTLLGGKLNGTLDAYINTTKDLLIKFPVAGTGYDNQYRNMGKTENKGFEASLTWHAVNKKDWGIDLSGNISVNKSKIKSLGDMTTFAAATRWASSEIPDEYQLVVGGQVGEIYGYKSAGRYEVSDFQGYDATTGKWILKEGVPDATNIVGQVRPGSMKLVDQPTLNEDGTYSTNGQIGAEDIVKIGNVNPDFTGGFAINAHAYGFDLAANFNFSVGNEEYNGNKIECTQTGKYQYRNLITDMADGKRWTNLNEDGTLCNDPVKLEEMNKNTTMWSPYTRQMVLTDWAIEKASFLRLNTLTLGYTIPQTITKRVGINSLRFYATAYNVFTITNYSGYDPESDCIKKSGQENLTPSCDYSGYPRSRSFVFGLNLNF